MDAHLSPFVMIMVAFPLVGSLWLATGTLRRTHSRLYKWMLAGLVLVCVVGVLAGVRLGAPQALVDWLVCFGFAFMMFDILRFYESKAQDERAQEEARLAEVDEMLKRMRDGRM